MPIQIEEIGPTNPAAGVIATSPATAPLAAPSTVGFPRYAHSTNIQVSAAAAVALFVATKALVANAPDATALPALNPNHPNHRSEAPNTVNGRLCGVNASDPYPRRRPMAMAAANAATPELICTTVPPAKSNAPMLRTQPPTAHTQ